MAARHMASVIRYLRRVAAPPGDTDGELLRRFAQERDEAAFTALLRRHGPLVFGVCQRILQNQHDAEDAFQATFLVFARKARWVAKPESLADWLFGVAYRTSCKARAGMARRRAKERQAAVRTPAADSTSGVVWGELRPVLDDEVSRLPEKYRVPFVLCYLDGRTNEEAARLIGCPKGTVLSRLATARERLRSRLTRRGITLSAGLLAVALSEGVASAVLPPLLAGSTAKSAAAGLASAAVVSLAEGVLRAMRLTKLTTPHPRRPPIPWSGGPRVSPPTRSRRKQAGSRCRPKATGSSSASWARKRPSRAKPTGPATTRVRSC
jgi:RNA polymerase sigma factor (sigma-70 family)